MTSFFFNTRCMKSELRSSRTSGSKPRATVSQSLVPFSSLVTMAFQSST